MRFGGLRHLAVLGAVLVVSATAGTGFWRAQVAKDVRERELIRNAGAALAFADSLEKSLAGKPVAGIATDDAISALYLERLRLGTSA
jgi:hypothetical protein